MSGSAAAAASPIFRVLDRPPPVCARNRFSHTFFACHYWNIPHELVKCKMRKKWILYTRWKVSVFWKWARILSRLRKGLWSIFLQLGTESIVGPASKLLLLLSFSLSKKKKSNICIFIAIFMSPHLCFKAGYMERRGREKIKGTLNYTRKGRRRGTSKCKSKKGCSNNLGTHKSSTSESYLYTLILWYS